MAHSSERSVNMSTTVHLQSTAAPLTNNNNKNNNRFARSNRHLFSTPTILTHITHSQWHLLSCEYFPSRNVSTVCTVFCLSFSCRVCTSASIPRWLSPCVTMVSMNLFSTCCLRVHSLLNSFSKIIF